MGEYLLAGGLACTGLLLLGATVTEYSEINKVQGTAAGVHDSDAVYIWRNRDGPSQQAASVV